MTLTTRVSVFFLSVLAIVLVGFSGILLWLAWVHLTRQVDERLEGALQTLSAAAEIEGPLIDWEPSQHNLVLGRSDSLEEVRWVVADEHDVVIDQSANVASASFLTDIGSASSSTAQRVRNYQGKWQVAQKRVVPSDEQAKVETPSAAEPLPRYRTLTLIAAVSLEPMNASLRTLGVTLSCLSAGLWVMAALAGRWLCRRALYPVTEMAAAARAMKGSDLSQRLPPGTTRDELEDLSQAFNKLLDRLQESFERQRRFTGDASHQLRTPLASMLGQMEVALRRDRSAEDYQHVLKLVNCQADRLRQIVESLLFLARADAEGRLPQIEKIDVASWLKEHLDLWAGHARAKDLVVKADAATPFWVHGQAVLLGQMVDNVMDNACKHSLPGTPIILRLSNEEKAVTLTIADYGQGIDAADIPHIFEPFYRTGATRLRGISGTGLGLAVAKRIADALGVDIDVRSEIGKGSQFRFVFHAPADGLPHHS